MNIIKTSKHTLRQIKATVNYQKWSFVKGKWNKQLFCSKQRNNSQRTEVWVSAVSYTHLFKYNLQDVKCQATLT